MKQISIIDEINFDSLKYLCSIQRPVSLLVSGKANINSLLNVLYEMDKGVCFSSTDNMKTKGILCTVLGINIFSMNLVYDIKIKDGFYIGYKEYSSILDFVEDINNLI